MMNDDNRFEAAFKEAGGDMHDMTPYDHDEPFTWPEIALGVALVVSVGGLTWWLI